MNSILSTLVIVAILGGCGAALYQKHQTSVQQEQAGLERRLGQVKLAIQERASHLTALKRHYDAQRKIYDNNVALEETRSALNELDATIDSQKRTYQHILDSRRNKANGNQIALLELPDGRTFRSVRIMGFDEKTLTLQTADGIVKLTAAEVPDMLKDYFRVDVLKPELQQAVEEAPAFVQAAPLEPLNTNPSGNPVGPFRYTADAYMQARLNESRPDGKTVINDQIKLLTARIAALQRAKQAPLTGMDRYLRVGSSAHKMRKQNRDSRLDQEIAVLASRKNALQGQLKQITSR